MADWIWVDGSVNGTIPADDRGFNLADGVFETLRIEQGRPALLELHRQRLILGLDALSFDQPTVIADSTLRQLFDDFSRDCPTRSGSLRITFSRGSGPRGYAPPTNAHVRVAARFVDGLPGYSATPSSLCISDIRWPLQPVLAGHKLLARTEQILAAICARRLGADDALMLDQAGRWLSTASGNMFLRRGNTLLTPALSAAGIAGTRRRNIIEYWADQLGFSVEVRDLDECDARLCDEAFSCNAIAGIRPIGSVGDLTFTQFSAAERLSSVIHRQPEAAVGSP